MLGYIYQAGVLSGQRDGAKALPFFESSAGEGNMYGQFYLGTLYEYGEGVAQDVNRAIEDFDVGLIDGTWPLPVSPTEFSKQGIGLVWRHIGVDGPIYARKLQAEEVLKRIYYCWRPYHERLGQLIDRAHARFGVAYHINFPSMPCRRDG